MGKGILLDKQEKENSPSYACNLGDFLGGDQIVIISSEKGFSICGKAISHFCKSDRKIQDEELIAFSLPFFVVSFCFFFLY